MIKLIDLVYYSHNDCKDPNEVLRIHAPSIGFADHIKHKLKIRFVKHLDYKGKERRNNIEYVFFKRPNNFWQIPFKTHRYIKTQQPDVVIAEGLIFPLQVMALKYTVGKKCKIICQHHGEKPFKGIKRIFQKLADRYIDAYMFTSCDNSLEWINEKIINNPGKCAEVLEASTYMAAQDKTECKKRSVFSGNANFLWVGRLNANKDPLTVLKAFKQYININSEARLYMIYQTEELLSEIKNFLNEDLHLKSLVFLKGKINHDELAEWYSAADFFISASRTEGSGYALLEAMACGCIPVVTNIPSFKKITMEGKFGFLFEPGNVKELVQVLNNLDKISQEKISALIISHFKNSLSFKNISDDIFSLCRILTGK